MSEPGRLVLVGTPIGNLGDLSPRAVGVLRDATVIAAEDTRRTRALLSHAGIRAEVIYWTDLLEIGSWVKAKSEGKLRVEGKDYEVVDGDVLEIRFNV